MTTYILSKITRQEHSGFATNIFYGGLEYPLLVWLQDYKEKDKIPTDSYYAISGEFREYLNPIRIQLYAAFLDKLPQADNWVTFIVTHLMKYKLDIRLDKSLFSETSISFSDSDICFACKLSKDNRRITKLEFCRYLPLEKDSLRRETSWVKGVFVNNSPTNLKFLQGSWLGEEDSKYCLDYNDEGKQKFINAMKVPLEIGWTEVDTSVGEDNFYKSTAIVTNNGKVNSWTFNLLDIGQQDIPMIADFPLRWLARFYFDGPWCNPWRQTVTTKVISVKDRKQTSR